MAYVPIPKDLSAVKTKFALGMTKRQVVCFGLAALTGVPLFFLAKTVIPVNLAALIMVAVMVPWFMFALYERNGQPLERYLKYMIAAKFIKPGVRTYQTGNLYAVAERQANLYCEVRGIAKNI